MNDKSSDWQISSAQLSALAVAVWRIQRRIQRSKDRSKDTPETVQLACEGIADRLHEIGLDWKDLIGEPYHENMCVQVIETQGSHDLRITECLSPAVYMKNQLIRQAEVVVGEETKG